MKPSVRLFLLVKNRQDSIKNGLIVSPLAQKLKENHLDVTW